MCLPLDAGTAAAEDAVPPPPPDMPPPPPPPDADAMPGPAMPPADYNYDYSAAYGAVPGTDAEQQWCASSNSCPYGPTGLHHGPQWPTVHRHGCFTSVHATSPLLLCLCACTASIDVLVVSFSGHSRGTTHTRMAQRPCSTTLTASLWRRTRQLWRCALLSRYQTLPAAPNIGQVVSVEQRGRCTCSRTQPYDNSALREGSVSTAPALILHDDAVCIRHGLPVVTYESCCRTRGRSRTPIGS